MPIWVWICTVQMLEERALQRIPLIAASSKYPALRNVGLTHPYMHDGRFYTLDMVLDHYSSGIVQNGRLDPRLPGPFATNSEQEKQDIIAFLSTHNGLSIHVRFAI
jgi:cytochrome c peroxidase